ncbi:MAG: RecX family transcriptional regulator [Bacteroides sp.]|nr:RecX family transcriptional regulator [Bacteroides sp.]
MKIKRQITPKEALIRLEELCATSERCSWEIKTKAFKWGLDPDATEKILQRLIDGRYVDDLRFAKAYTKEKYLFSRWGRHKIATALYVKRIDRQYIETALSEIDPRQYAENAFHVIAGKLRCFNPEDDCHEIRSKLLKFGMSRGFETRLILKILDSRKLWAQFDK